MTDAADLNASTKRAVPEWRGKTPDTPIPRLVKARIWLREGGRCYLTGKRIERGDAFQYEHVKAIANGGENRETNIRLALTDKHKEKSADDRAEQTKTERVHAKHHGYWPKSKATIRSRGFEPSRPRTSREGDPR